MINEKTATKLGTVFKRSMDKLFRYHPRWHWQHREESAYQPPMNDNAYQPYQSQHVLPLGAMVLHKYVLEQLQRELRYEVLLFKWSKNGVCQNKFCFFIWIKIYKKSEIDWLLTEVKSQIYQILVLE